MNCHQRSQEDCSLLRRYVSQSWPTLTSSNENERLSRVAIPFRWFCDSFWNLRSREDENLLECRQYWICPKDQRRCQTGQCLEQSWFNDGDWDCPDASDEHPLLISFSSDALREASRYNFTNRSYSISSSCPQQSHPFLCLSLNATRQGFDCFNLSQIDDGRIDCAGGIDERLTFPSRASSSSMLGTNFFCQSTNTWIPFHLHCLADDETSRCPNRSDDKFWCDRQHRPWNSNAFTCFHPETLVFSRCDKISGCLFGEDEYLCDYSRSIYGPSRSREEKESFLRLKSPFLHLSLYPLDLHFTQFNFDSISTSTRTNLSFNHSSSPYWCNRGAGVLLGNTSRVVCFCPPQYYGEKCQFHTDRLSVLPQFNFSSSSLSRLDSQILLKLVVLFLADDEVQQRDQFHLHSSFESEFHLSRLKMIAHFPLSSREQRRRRFFNRSSLLLHQPYSIRIELYQIPLDKQPHLIALWRYSLPFSHLPVSRLAKVLHLTESLVNPCSSRPCRHPNEQCQPLMNNRSQFICLCKTTFTGENCSDEDLRCRHGYCSPGSLFQANSRGSSPPFCLCSFNRFGHRCEIEHDGCLSSPCLHGGECLPTPNLIG